MKHRSVAILLLTVALSHATELRWIHFLVAVDSAHPSQRVPFRTAFDPRFLKSDSSGNAYLANSFSFLQPFSVPTWDTGTSANFAAITKFSKSGNIDYLYRVPTFEPCCVWGWSGTGIQTMDVDSNGNVSFCGNSHFYYAGPLPPAPGFPDEMTRNFQGFVDSQGGGSATQITNTCPFAVGLLSCTNPDGSFYQTATVYPENPIKWLHLGSKFIAGPSEGFFYIALLDSNIPDARTAPALISPAELHVGELAPLTLAPDIKSSGDTYFQWYHNGSQIQGATSFVLSNISQTASGLYSLVASNNYGST